MPVNIHGRDYETVAERLTAAGDSLVGVVTDLVGEDAQTLDVRATITTNKGVFSGHARSRKGMVDKHGELTPEGEFPLEVAETSAVGRALAFAYGSSESVASAEEVQRSKPIVQQGVPTKPPGAAPFCNCGVEREWVDKISKTTGNPFQGWFCVHKKCEVLWPKREPENVPEEGTDIPFEIADEEPAKKASLPVVAAWSRFWMRVKELRMTKQGVHRMFEVPLKDGALAEHAEKQAKAFSITLQQMIDNMTAELNPRHVSEKEKAL